MGDSLPDAARIRVSALWLDSHALDYDERGELVSLEVADASRRITEPWEIEFQTTT